MESIRFGAFALPLKRPGSGNGSDVIKLSRLRGECSFFGSHAYPNSVCTGSGIFNLLVEWTSASLHALGRREGT